MIEQGFHDNTEHNYVFAFVFKKIAGKIPGSHRWGNTKAHKSNKQKFNQNDWDVNGFWEVVGRK